MITSTSLYSRNGEFVTNVKMPRFGLRPEMVQWGARFFYWSKSEQKYIEGMMWVDMEMIRNAEEAARHEMGSFGFAEEDE